jgi:hypothetical protein
MDSEMKSKKGTKIGERKRKKLEKRFKKLNKI